MTGDRSYRRPQVGPTLVRASSETNPPGDGSDRKDEAPRGAKQTRPLCAHDAHATAPKDRAPRAAPPEGKRAVGTRGKMTPLPAVRAHPAL